ncbi:hypothetical protein RRG08_028160 [Elysia crispata]|uniref:Uncharacterized protein n=1 Tax=Elysia crispata TaxID=231223 RepID=A0AAE0YQ40_9GAST|nr:hypothetical protein RRG08_028160 [Elysia crispata]
MLISCFRNWLMNIGELRLFSQEISVTLIFFLENNADQGCRAPPGRLCRVDRTDRGIWLERGCQDAHLGYPQHVQEE